MPAIRKTFAAKVTVSTDTEDQPGTFEAIVAVFGNEDTDGDIVERGAFAATLKRWAETGDPLPVMWSHQNGDPDSILGHYLDAKEVEGGLWVKGLLDLDHPRAARIHKLMLQRLITEFSWQGEVLKYEILEPESPDDWFWSGIRILEIDLWEAGPCFKGANRDTELLAVKAADHTGPIGERIRRQGKTAGQEAISATSVVDDLTPEPPAVDAPPADPTPEAEADAADTHPDVQRASAATKARALLELITTHQ